MEKYDTISVVGEGSYGLVMKCRHRETGTLVAIKKFLETEEDATVRKMALREIRMLKKLRHENLVNMLEVFRRKRRFYLVFEYLERTVLDELEGRGGGGLGDDISRKYIYQVIRAIEFCHANNVIHRDVKPENVLVSRSGVIKLCDFGFARPLAQPAETYTDYVATRWYRAPELLVGDTRYGGPVDIWAIGCLFSEMMTGDPLFPGDSDVDQLFQIIKALGKLSARHQHFISRNPMFKGFKKSQLAEEGIPIYQLFPSWPRPALDLLEQCLKLDPIVRPKAHMLLKHEYFTQDSFTEKYLPELRQKIYSEFQCNPLLKKYQSAILVSSRRDEEEHRDEDAESLTEKPSVILDHPQHKWKINLLGFDGKKKNESVDSLNEENKNSKTIISKPVLHQNVNTKCKEAVKSKSDTLTEKSDQISYKFNQSLQSLLHRNSSNNVCKDIANKQIDSRFPPSRQQSATTADKPSPSPIPFQSLQHDPYNQNTSSLQPSITNISFNNSNTNNNVMKNRSPFSINQKQLNEQQQQQQSKKLQNAYNNSPVPVQFPPKTLYIKRYDRGLLLDVAQLSEKNQISSQKDVAPAWMSGNNKNSKKNDRDVQVWKSNKANDDFTLPNLPGAYGSPSKLIKKKLQSLHVSTNHASCNDTFLTPRNRSANSKTNANSTDLLTPTQVTSLNKFDVNPTSKDVFGRKRKQRDLFSNSTLQGYRK